MPAKRSVVGIWYSSAAIKAVAEPATPDPMMRRRSVLEAFVDVSDVEGDGNDLADDRDRW
jgi:hypothetical protein